MIPEGKTSSGATSSTSGARLKEELGKLGFGVSCRKGLKPESPNQDSFSMLYIEGELLLCGVYDGHGQSGHHVSQFTKEMLPKLFLSDPNRVKGKTARPNRAPSL